MSEYQRLDEMIPDQTAADLRELSQRGETSVTEIVSLAIGLYYHLEMAEQRDKGLLITTTTNNVEKDGSMSLHADRRYLRLDGDNLLYERATQDSSIKLD